MLIHSEVVLSFCPVKRNSFSGPYFPAFELNKEKYRVCDDEDSDVYDGKHTIILLNYNTARSQEVAIPYKVQGGSYFTKVPLRNYDAGNRSCHMCDLSDYIVLYCIAVTTLCL